VDAFHNLPLFPQPEYEAHSAARRCGYRRPGPIENAGIRSVREIIIVSTMTPFFIALLAPVASSFRSRPAQQAEIVALRHQIAILQQVRHVVCAFDDRTDFCGFGCPVSGRAGGADCAS
jgi:hypothetical protein